MTKIKFAFLLTLLSTLTAQAATVAIIDSGTDMLHKDIAPKAWINEGEIPKNDSDDDMNGYLDDVHGWNFAENNEKVIDYTHLGTLTYDIRRFFEIQAKAIQGQATEDEINWMRDRIQDQEFVAELSKYGNFMHGTHVAGIAMKDTTDSKVMALKIIPTEQNPFSVLKAKLVAKANEEGGGWKDTLGKIAINQGLAYLAKEQMKLLEQVAIYVNHHGAKVANGSFGTGYNQAAMIVEMAYKTILNRAPTEEELHETAMNFMNTLLRQGDHFLRKAENTLFVFAAGNDGSNNDLYPTSPTNLKGSNVLSVAATMGLNAIAPFSNFGNSTVDVAAPGVAINSAVPGNQYLQVSGTSQAAPYVANMAALILEKNEELLPGQVKQIIMGTVDKRGYLKGLVKTSGLVNTARASLAAELTNTMTIKEAIKRSRRSVADQVEEFVFGRMHVNKSQAQDAFVAPLPGLFNLK